MNNIILLGTKLQNQDWSKPGLAIYANKKYLFQYENVFNLVDDTLKSKRYIFGVGYYVMELKEKEYIYIKINKCDFDKSNCKLTFEYDVIQASGQKSSKLYGFDGIGDFQIIKESEVGKLIQYYKDKKYTVPEELLNYETYITDITTQVLKDTQQYGGMDKKPVGKKVLDMNKIFIVHGRDNEAKLTIARFVEKLGFKAIILHEQVSDGMTIIEKIEKNTNVGFAIVLYTPCDMGYSKDEPTNLKNRARQNVVFEHGYLISKIGRNNVCALVKGDIETPNDISGVVYIKMDKNEGWQLQLAKEMKSSGLDVDYNLL